MPTRIAIFWRMFLNTTLVLTRWLQSTRSFLSALNHDGKDWARYDVPLDPTVAHAGLEMEYSFDLYTWSPAATNPENTVVARKVATSWSLEVSTSNHPRSFFRLVGARPE